MRSPQIKAKYKLDLLCYSKVPLRSKLAIVKYMTSPETSTSVATKGAEEAAGSNLSFFRIKGSIEPLRLPHSTIPIKLQATVVPTRTKCSP